MSWIHALTRKANGETVIVVHVDVPDAENPEGVAWSTCLVNSGRAVTSLPESTDVDDAVAQPGRISRDEKAAVEAGTVYEFRTSIPYESGDGGLASIHKMVDPKTNAHLAALVELFSRYGRELS